MKLKRAGIFTKILIVALIICAALTLVNLAAKVQSAKDDQAELQAAVDAQQASNEDIEYSIEHSEDPDVLEDVARDKLGLMHPDEHIYYDN